MRELLADFDMIEVWRKETEIESNAPAAFITPRVEPAPLTESLSSQHGQCPPGRSPPRMRTRAKSLRRGEQRRIGINDHE